MRGGPKSRSRRTSRSFPALIALALAPACGSGPTAGVRLGAGGSGGATTDGGGGGGGGALTDGGRADGLAPFDGGVCADDSGNDPSATPASGTFSGSAVGAVCTGGTFASVESTPGGDGAAPTVLLYIDTLSTGNAAAHLRFEVPANVTAGQVQVFIGLPAGTPGTYTESTTCGSAVLLATLPAPDPSVCAVDAGTGLVDCPAGCEATGALNQVCTPLPPQLTYAALAASDCVGDSTTPLGSWTLTLTSLTAEPGDAGAGSTTFYKPHGTLTATLADQSSDAGTAGVTLTLSF